MISTTGAKSEQEPSRLSVVIPVHNGAVVLAQCLDALARSELKPFECIVVADGCDDDTEAVAARHGASVLTLEQRGGPARARNRGAASARGDVILFLDADVCVHADTLALIDRHFSEHPGVAAIMGSYDDRPASAGVVSQFKNLFHHYVHQHSRTDAGTFWAGCGAVRAAAFTAVGGFDETYTRPCIEDIELGIRLRRQGERIVLDHDVQVTHLKRWTLGSLVTTDVRDRALPWLLLMWRDRTLPNDLNTRLEHRVSVVLVWLMVGAAGVALAGRPVALIAVALAAAALVALNVDLYRFFARRRGLGFALACIPLHWFYYWYCGAALALAPLWYAWHELVGTHRRTRRPALRDSLHG